MSTPLITRQQLAKALGSIWKDSVRASQWDYDSLSCVRLNAKAEFADELACALGLDRLPEYQKAIKGD
jgi:hypothetical protein